MTELAEVSRISSSDELLIAKFEAGFAALEAKILKVILFAVVVQSAIDVVLIQYLH